MKELWNNHKKEIIIGVGCSIFGTILLEIVRWIIETAPSVGNSILSGLENQIYIRASKITILDILGSFFVFLLVIFLEIVLHISIRALKTIRYTKREKNAGNTGKSLDKTLGGGKKKTGGGDCNNIDKDVKEKELKKKEKELKHASIWLILISVLFFVVVFFYVVFPIHLKDNFDVSVKQISPFIEEQDRLKLESDWISMKSQADYEKISDYINSIKEENNLPN